MITRAPDGRPFRFGDLPAEAFPVTITGFVDDVELWERTVEPYAVVEIPEPAPKHRGRVRVRLRFGDGTEVWQEPEP